MTSEVKVGILFFLGLGLVVWFTFFVTGIGRKKAEFMVAFRRTDQLKEGDGVTYNGTRVGTVSSVEPAVTSKNEPYVAVGFTIDSQFKDKILVDDSTEYTIRVGVLGGAMLGIESHSGHPISQRDNHRQGNAPSSISDIIQGFDKIIDENRENLKESIAALKDSMKSFGEMSAEARDVIRENREEIKNTIANASGAFGNIKDLMERNKEVLDSMLANIERAAGEIKEMLAENRKDIRETITYMPSTVDSVRAAFQNVEKIIAENREDIRQLIAKLAEFAPKLDKTGENLEVITTQIAEGKGSLGKLVFTDTLHDNAVDATTNLNQRLEEVKPLTQAIGEVKLYVGLDGGGNIDSGSETGSAYLRIEPRSYKFYQAGISYRTEPSDRDVVDEDPNDFNVDFNLLFGWRFLPDDRHQVYWATLAGGIIESKPGGRLDIPLYSDRLLLSTMVRQKDNDRELDDRRYEEGSVMLRSTIEYQPFRRYRIKLIAGVDDIIDDPGLWVGIRAELLDNDLRNLTTFSVIPQ